MTFIFHQSNTYNIEWNEIPQSWYPLYNIRPHSDNPNFPCREKPRDNQIMGTRHTQALL